MTPLTRLQLGVVVDFTRAPAGNARLQVTNEGSAYVALSQADRTGRRDGTGSFARSFSRGDQVTVTTQPIYGRLQFDRWTDAAGRLLSTSNSVSLSLATVPGWKQIDAVQLVGSAE